MLRQGLRPLASQFADLAQTFIDETNRMTSHSLGALNEACRLVEEVDATKA